ncbi:MAG: Cache 3/Cache 2 fusion domain-containing protein [Desulfonauticus sp.]|nr:Cache 3/Cache 2 fusion domain-containing protein [Desulfonauticus sp.]
MLNVKRVKVTTKLYTGIILILIAGIISLSLFSIYQAKFYLTKMGKNSVISSLDGLYHVFKMKNKAAHFRARYTLATFEQKISEVGGWHLDFTRNINLTLKNSLETVNIPVLLLGEEIVYNNSKILNDVIKTIHSKIFIYKKVGTKLKKVSTTSQISIYQVFKDKLIKINTTFTNPDGSKDIGSYIDCNNPIYKKIMEGKNFSCKEHIGKTWKNWYISVYHPIKNRQNKIIAVIQASVKIFSPNFTHFIERTKLGGKGAIFIYDANKKTIIKHTNPNFIGKSILTVISDKFKNVADKQIVTYKRNGDLIFTYVRYFKPWDWYICVSLTENELAGHFIQTLIINNLGLGLGIICLGIVLVFFIIKIISGPLEKIAEISERVAEGDYRPVDFMYLANDVIGRVVESFKKMIQNNQTMLQNIQKSTENVYNSSLELNEISDDVAKTATNMTQISDTANKLIKESVDNISSVSASMKELTINANTIASAAEEMSVTINEIASNTTKAKEITSIGVEKSQIVSSRVNELNKAAQEITSVTDTIASISSQTNLLALNATIEAARAGEAGKGFAVVANEIKELAQQTAKATEDIKQKIEGIQQVTNVSIVEIEEVTKIINEMNEIINTIVTAIEEQSITTRDIAQNVNQVSQAIGEGNETLAEIAINVKEVEKEIAVVHNISEQLNKNGNILRQNANNLSALSEKLKELITKFKI